MIQYDPRLQGRPNGTDVLGGPQPPQDTGMASTSQQPAQPAQPAQYQQTNLATKKPSSSTSGMYTNIQQYAEKNKPAAQQMSQSVGQTVQRSADIARKNIQATRQQFENLRETGSLQNRETAVGDVTSAAQAAAGMQVDQPTAGDERLKAILDAVYKGPERLQQMGSFGESQRRAQEAGRLTQQLTGGNQNELLKKSLERQGQRYTQGSRQLDKLLFGNEEPKQYLQQTQKQIGNVGQDLTEATYSARQDAIQRAQELQDIRSKSRESLQSTATGRAQQVEDYIQSQKDAGSGLADYYTNLLTQGTTFNEEGKLVDSQGRKVFQNAQEKEKEILSLQKQIDQEKSGRIPIGKIGRTIIYGNKTPDQNKIKALEQKIADTESMLTTQGLDLGQLEAATLGVKSGTGLYNLLRDKTERDALLESFDASKLASDQMITKAQQGQLAELQRLAQLSRDYGVQGSGIDYRSAYQDAEKAGTQDAFDALNLEKFRGHLTGAERDFRTEADSTTIGVGSGKANYDKGLYQEGTIKKTAYKRAKLKDILEKSGYDFDSDPENFVYGGGEDILKNLSDVVKTENLHDYGGGLSTVGDWVNEGLQTYLFGALSSEEIMGLLGLEDFSLGNIGDKTGELVQSFGKDIGGDLIGGTLGSWIESGLGSVGGFISDAASGLLGGGKSEAKKKAQYKAEKAALADLKRKLTGRAETTGFGQRINVADTEQSTERTKDLLKLLGMVSSEG